MDIKKTVHQMMGLGECWAVEECHYEEEANSFFIVVKETPKLWEVEKCPTDRGDVFCYDHVAPMRWRHLNIFNKACEIVCELPRGKCRNCGKVYRIHPPWEGKSKHFTKEFEAFALTLMKEMPMKKVEEITGAGDDRLWRMLIAHVMAGYEKLSMEEVTVVGADEMSLRKGHQYLTVFCDLLAKRVLYATEGKDAETWVRFGEELLKHNGHPHAITQASIDMSPAYQAGVEKTCRNAALVFDKYHVIANVNKSMDEVRRIEYQHSPAAKNLLKETMWLWRKNPETLNSRQSRKLQRIDRQRLYTAKAYQMKLALREIYQLGAKTAERKFKSWIRWVKREVKKSGILSPMLKAAEMVERHLPGIMGHWIHGITNAFLEGLNSVFSATKRKARGYRTTQNLIAMLYFTAAKLDIPFFKAVPFHSK